MIRDRGNRDFVDPARNRLGEPQVVTEPDEEAIVKEGVLHGDDIRRLPDGTHEVHSVAPGPADHPTGGWANKPVGRKGDRALTETAEESEARFAEQRESDAQ